MAREGADYLCSPAAADLDAAALGEVLVSLGEVQSRLSAAQALFLRRFDAAGAHDSDGYGSSSAWLAAMAKISKRDAKAAVRQMHQLRTYPHLAGALGRGEISQSWAGEVAGWLRKLPEELRSGTEEILGRRPPPGRPSTTSPPSPPTP